MACLASSVYDPGTAGSQSTAALLAMTAMDTTNLRLTFTAPANGSVMVRLRCITTGAGSTPMILLGVLDGSTVRGRISPISPQASVSGAGTQPREAQFVVTGLTPGNSYTFDAAYAVQVLVASTAIKYGGPNNTTNNDAWGAIEFSIWEAGNLLAATLYDPAGAVSVSTAALTAMTAFDTTNLRLSFTAPSSGRVLVRMQTVQSSVAGSQPMVHLGVLDGSTIMGRMASGSTKEQSGTGLATDHYNQAATFMVNGLTPSNSYTWDAAYGVEANALASMNIKYGGPNDASGADAWGGFAYEIWAA